MMTVMPILVILSAVDLRLELQPPFGFWFMQLFFLCLIVFSVATLIRSGGASGAGGPADTA